MTEDEIIHLAAEAKLWLHSDRDYEKVEKFANLVAAAEREACAMICEELKLPDWPNKIRQPLAAAIRARGQ